MSDTFDPASLEETPAAGAASDATEDQLAQAANDAESATADETTADQTGADAEPQKARGVQKRLDELTAQRRQAERDRDYWREMAMRQGQQPPQQQPANQSQPPQPDPVAAAIAQHVGPAPKPEDFPAGEFDPGYRDARDQWVEKRAEARAVMAAEQRMRAHQAASVEQQFRQSFSQQVAELAKADEGAVASIAALGQRLPDQVANAIASMGADVAHYIATNPEAEARIKNAPNPWAVATELGEIRAAVKARRAAPVTQPSSAPPPPSRVVRGGGSSAPDPDKMSMAQFAATYGKDLSHRSV